MRTTFMIATLCVLPACQSQSAQNIDSMGLTTYSGWGESMGVRIFRQGDIAPNTENWPFNGGQWSETVYLEPAQFERVAQALEPYRAAAVPISSLMVHDIVNGPACEPVAAYVTDHGGFHIGWHISSESFVTMVDRGCDAERNARRNDRLDQLLRALVRQAVAQRLATKRSR